VVVLGLRTEIGRSIGAQEGGNSSLRELTLQQGGRNVMGGPGEDSQKVRTCRACRRHRPINGEKSSISGTEQRRKMSLMTIESETRGLEAKAKIKRKAKSLRLSTPSRLQHERMKGTGLIKKKRLES